MNPAQKTILAVGIVVLCLSGLIVPIDKGGYKVETCKSMIDLNFCYPKYYPVFSKYIEANGAKMGFVLIEWAVVLTLIGVGVYVGGKMGRKP